MPNFLIPLSGLNASSAALATTANNLANLNTVGYKDQETQFADLFYQSLGTDGAGDPIQQGAGVKVSAQPSNFTQGNVTATGIDTNVAINGNGFFIVQQNGVRSYTRAGNFGVGTDNLLETVNGQQVLGYQAVNGVVNTGGGLGTLALGAGTVSPASATANVSMTSNLDATDAPGTTYSSQATIYDSLGASHQVTFTYTNADSPYVPAVPGQAATGTLTTTGGGAGNTIVAGSTVTVGGVTYTFMTGPVGTTANAVLVGADDTATIGNLVDAINASTTSDTNATGGGAATDFGSLTVANPLVTAAQSANGAFTFTAKTDSATAVAVASSNTAVLSWNAGAGTNGVTAVPAIPAVVNTWTYAVTLPAADVSGATAPLSLATGTIVFNGDGTLKSITPTAGVASTTNPVIAVPPTTNPVSVFADGANQLSFTWNVFDAAGNGLLTQTAAASSTASIQQDGSASGTLVNFSIGADGTISGSFSNGKTATVGQIALASFADEEGLSRDGANDFSPTLASGQPAIGAPTSGVLGNISGGALEQSNVDIATEFANLIVAQRSYEANARVITTFDQVTQDTIALKQ
ncbi:MAG: flagellar hook-basal body complex protein [Terriglobales bacterium]